MCPRHPNLGHAALLCYLSYLPHAVYLFIYLFVKFLPPAAHRCFWYRNALKWTLHCCFCSCRPITPWNGWSSILCHLLDITWGSSVLLEWIYLPRLGRRKKYSGIKHLRARMAIERKERQKSWLLITNRQCFFFFPYADCGHFCAYEEDLYIFPAKISRRLNDMPTSCKNFPCAIERALCSEKRTLMFSDPIKLKV